MGNTESQLTTTMKQYAKYLSENGMMRDDSGMNEAIKNLPHNSVDVIKSHIDLLMNGDNNPIAIAAQEAEVNFCRINLTQSKVPTMKI